MQVTQEMWVRSLSWEDPLEEEMATHSSLLAWRIPWTEEPGGPQSMGLQSQTQLSTYAYCSRDLGYSSKQDRQTLTVFMDLLFGQWAAK